MHRNPEINRRIRELWDSGFNIASIAMKVGFDRKTIRIALREQRDDLRRPLQKERSKANAE